MGDSNMTSASAEWEFLDAVYNSADIGICVTDENRRFVRVNDAYCETYGYTREELIGQPFTRVLPEGIRETAARMHDEFLAGGDESAGEWQVLRKDGSVRDIIVTAGRVATPDDRRFKVTTVTDITERKATESTLQRTENELRSLIENLPDGILLENDARQVRLANQALMDLFAAPDPPHTLIGSDCRDTAEVVKTQFKDPQGFSAGIEARIGRGIPALAERLETTDGRILQRDYVPIPHDGDERAGHLWRYQDITEQIRAAEKIQRMTHFDTLTGLPNRFLLNDRLEQAILRLDRSSSLIAVAYIDLDGFKQINDTHGQTRGDWALNGIARRMRSSLREADVLARMGGDEFVVVLEGLPDRAAGEAVIEHLHATIGRETGWAPRKLPISASIGLTFYPQRETLQAEQLVRQADQAMYAAKRAGTSRRCIFDPEHDHAIRGHYAKIESIRQALAVGEFSLYYQPKVDLRSGTVIGAEALIRWQHPQRGLLSPAEFLPELEGTATSVEIGDWVMETAVEQIVAWRRQNRRIPVSINVDGHQIAQPDFVDKLCDCLRRHPDMEPDDLELEVLESSALEDIEGVRAVISACKEIGVGFALDDFGTGFSTLNYVKRLPAPTLKIDQGFVRNMLDDADDLAILDAVQGLARSFSRDTIAEGVETIEHGTMLLALGCRFAQGFGIARPMPPEALPTWIDQWTLPPQWQTSGPVHRDDLPALFATVDYRRWLYELERAIFGNGPAPALDPNACSLGRWLAGSIVPISEAALSAANRQRRTKLNRIRAIYKELFDDARLMVAGNSAPTAETWRSFMARNDEMLAALFDALSQRQPAHHSPAPGPIFPGS